MLITNHVLAGTLIGLEAPNVPAAVALGVASHLAMDAVPHWGVDDDAQYLRVARIDGVTGLLVSATALAVAPAADRPRIAGAIFGACLPDTDQVSAHFFGRKFHPVWFDRLHGAIQTEHGWLRQELILATGLGVAAGWALTTGRRVSRPV